MDDLISRQEAINALKSQANIMRTWVERYNEQRAGILTAVNIIEDLPPAQPDQERGKWEEKQVVNMDDTPENAIAEWQSARCSKCGKYHTTPYMYYFSHYNFCPHCGSPMQK